MDLGLAHGVYYKNEESKFGNYLGLQNGLNLGLNYQSFKIDKDVKLFIIATQIKDLSQIIAINNLVINFKSFGLWNKMKAIYPFIGGTAFTHKFNLKNPKDTDEAFRLDLSANLIHSSNGIQPGNGLAFTFITPAKHFQRDSAHISYYSRTNNTVTQTVEISTISTGNVYKSEINLYGTTFYTAINENYTSNASASISDSRGFWVANRIENLKENGFRNGIKIIDTSISSTGLSNNMIYLFGQYPNFRLSNKQCAFVTIGDGLNDNDALNLYNIIQSYQTTLGRQV